MPLVRGKRSFPYWHVRRVYGFDHATHMWRRPYCLQRLYKTHMRGTRKGFGNVEKTDVTAFGSLM